MTIADAEAHSITIDADMISRVSAFLFRQARLLDELDYDAWFETFDEDLLYWAPGVQSRYRKDPLGGAVRGRMALFDDTLQDLKVRASRWKEDTAWAEDPPTRHCHFVTNVEVEPADNAGELVVHSLIISLRNRNEDEESWLGARRKDIVRMRGGQFKVARREIYLTQSVLLSKNLNTFL